MNINEKSPKKQPVKSTSTDAAKRDPKGKIEDQDQTRRGKDSEEEGQKKQTDRK